jgi:hypothetical protein
MIYDIAGPIKNLTSGNLDSWRGPYTSIDAANAAIPNNVVGGVSLRQGKFVEIGTAGNYVTYWWKGGYADGNLVPYVDFTPVLSQIPNIPGKPQVMGVEAPVVGTSASDRAYFFDAPITKEAPLNKVILSIGAASTLYLKRFKPSTDGLSWLYQNQISAPVVAGMNTIDISQSFEFKTGDILCLYTSGRLNFTNEPGWTSSKGSAAIKNVVTDVIKSTLDTSSAVNFQVRFEFGSYLLGTSDIINTATSESTNRPVSAKVAKDLNTKLDDLIKAIPTQLFQFGDVAPVVSLGAADRAYFMDAPVPYDGVFKKITIAITLPAPTVNAILYIKKFKKSSDNTKYLYQNQTQVTVQNGVNAISITEPFTFTKGDILALYCAGGQLNIRTDEATWSGIRATASVQNTTSDVTVSTLSTSAASLQVTFDIEVVNIASGTLTTDINPMITPDPQGFWMVPCYGQSLSINTNAGPSTFTAPVSIAYDQTGVNNNIQDMNGGYAEMFLAMSKEYKALPSDFKMMTCLGGAGGRSVIQLSKGSTYYTTLLNNIRAGKATADTLNKPYNVPAIVWTQGEEDYRAAGIASDYGTGDWNPNLYKVKLKKFLDEFDTDVKIITGQKNNVKMVMYQVSSHNAYYRYPRIAIQQLELAREDSRVSLAKSNYEADYNNNDWAHAPAKTYRNMGNHYGIALYNVTVKNERVLPINPTQHFLVGNDLYIKFYTPFRPLVFDTSTVAPLPDGRFGFGLYTVNNETNGALGTIASASEIITNVSLFGPDVIKISLSAIPPSGTRLAYGVNGDGYNSINGAVDGVVGKSGRSLGARGNLRDSRGYMNVVSNYFTMYNWCPIFEIVF